MELFKGRSCSLHKMQLESTPEKHAFGAVLEAGRTICECRSLPPDWEKLKPEFQGTHKNYVVYKSPIKESGKSSQASLGAWNVLALLRNRMCVRSKVFKIGRLFMNKLISFKSERLQTCRCASSYHHSSVMFPVRAYRGPNWGK